MLRVEPQIQSTAALDTSSARPQTGVLRRNCDCGNHTMGRACLRWISVSKSCLLNSVRNHNYVSDDYSVWNKWSVKDKTGRLTRMEAN